MTGSDSTAEIYDRAAQNWRRCAPVLLSDFTARPFVLDWCEPVGGCEVLDLGCGEGYVARQLKRRRAARVRGTDVSGEMIARALEEEEREPLGIEYRVGDARDLSWVADGSVDLAVAVFLFNYLDRAGTAAVMSEVHRVLRPGGRFVFAVPHPSLPFLRPEEPPFYFARAGRGYFSARDATLEGRIWRRDGIEVPVRCVHKTLSDYFDCLRLAGFRSLPDVEELHVTPAHLALDPAFFAPLRDTPLHLAFRTVKQGR
ncbi:MAG TPA: class I SAM-dependent methyltransferase [Planctomycetota bacterium]|nr:class I SAM-dependent methyltransferase [Planctomycetota bacterium]